MENISSSILVSGLARVSILQLMSTEERSEILTCTVKSQAQARSSPSQGSPVSWTEGRGWQTRILGAQTESPNISCHEAHVSNCQFKSCISNIYIPVWSQHLQETLSSQNLGSKCMKYLYWRPVLHVVLSLGKYNSIYRY